MFLLNNLLITKLIIFFWKEILELQIKEQNSRMGLKLYICILKFAILLISYLPIAQVVTCKLSNDYISK